MAKNFPGPFEVRIFYTTTLSTIPLTHEMRLNFDPNAAVAPGTDFSLVPVVNHLGSVSDLETELLAWIALMAPIYHNSATFDFAECWEYTPLTNDAKFVSTYDISDVGTSSTQSFNSGQAMFLFRTREGASMRINLMESIIVSGQPRAGSALVTAEANLVNYVIDPAVGGYWLGKDTSYPFAFTRLFPGQNEAIFKKRFR